MEVDAFHQISFFFPFQGKQLTKNVAIFRVPFIFCTFMHWAPFCCYILKGSNGVNEGNASDNMYQEEEKEYPSIQNEKKWNECVWGMMKNFIAFLFFSCARPQQSLADESWIRNPTHISMNWEREHKTKLEKNERNSARIILNDSLNSL